MVKGSYLSVHEIRLIIITIITSTLIFQFAEFFAKDFFTTFSQYNFLIQVIGVLFYIIILSIISLLSITFLIRFLGKFIGLRTR